MKEIRLNGLAGLLASIPYLLGFRPHDALILLPFTGTHLLCTAHIALGDLADVDVRPAVFLPTGIDPSTIGDLVAVVVVDDAAPAARQAALGIAHSALLPPLTRWVITDGTVYWLPDEDPDTAAPLDDHSATAAEWVGLGVRPAANRDDHLARWMHTTLPEDDTTTFHTHYNAALRDLIPNNARTVMAKLGRYAEVAPETITIRDAAWITAALTLGSLRDLWIGLTLRSDAPHALLDLWSAVAYHSPHGIATHCAWPLGVTAALAGDGALVNACADLLAPDELGTVLAALGALPPAEARSFLTLQVARAYRH